MQGYHSTKLDSDGVSADHDHEEYLHELNFVPLPVEVLQGAAQDRPKVQDREVYTSGSHNSLQFANYVRPCLHFLHLCLRLNRSFHLPKGRIIPVERARSVHSLRDHHEPRPVPPAAPHHQLQYQSIWEKFDYI